MKSIFLLAILGIGITIHAQEIDDFELESIDGNLVSYDNIKGTKITVIDFWATWCKPCVNSIPKLVDIYNSFNHEEVAFVGISIDSPRNLSKVKPFARSVGIEYPILLDPDQELMRDFNLSVIPTLLIINPENEIISIHEGFAPGDERKLKAEIDDLLHEKN